MRSTECRLVSHYSFGAVGARDVTAGVYFLTAEQAEVHCGHVVSCQQLQL